MHNGRTVSIVTISLFFSLFLFSACDRITTTSIGKILDNPRDFEGKKVTVSGEVTEVFSLIILKYFVLKDETGEIVVVTSKSLPRKGARLSAKGVVEEAFSIGDQQSIVIVEKKEETKEKTEE